MSMGAVVTKIWPTEPQARAFAAGVEFVNDGEISDVNVVPVGDGRWSVTFLDNDADPTDYAVEEHDADPSTSSAVVLPREYALITAPVEDREAFDGNEVNGRTLVRLAEVAVSLFAEPPTDVEILAVLNARIAPIGNYDGPEAGDDDAYNGLLTGERPACERWAWATLDASGSPVAGVVDDGEGTEWRKEVARAERFLAERATRSSSQG
jgi:hypothetical protein